MNHWIDKIPSSLLKESLRLMRVDKPIGTWLLMWPSLWALVAASPGMPDWYLLGVFAVGAFIMRSAGCVVNDIADRKFDPHVARTKDRPLAAMRISLKSALLLLLLLLFIALFLALQLNFFALKLCFAGAFLAVTYPFTKRYIHLPQFYMGTAFGWGVIIAWAAVTGTINPEAWIIFAATLTWAAAYDTIYAMMDREDDLKIGIKSTAILFGRYDLIAVGILYLLTLALLAWAGFRLELATLFYISLGIAFVQMCWQLWVIRDYPEDKFLATFLSNKWVGIIIFCGFLFGRA
ncbi:MAG: 4-hydroxybenzoate octaprenyltransferase [Magnetococcales bacterium]|nr:4-hydroxybenzoate octaprenyltransferase [Magnetococcales bacterium]